jgi:60 kDa SS-A/Ro ribonucleoprotein
VVPASAAVLRYVVHGLKEAKKDFGDKPEAQKVMSYLQTIEDFKHCTDEHDAARLVEMHSLLLEHIPGHLLKSKEVREVRHRCPVAQHLSPRPMLALIRC